MIDWIVAGIDFFHWRDFRVDKTGKILNFIVIDLNFLQKFHIKDAHINNPIVGDI